MTTDELRKLNKTGPCGEHAPCFCGAAAVATMHCHIPDEYQH
jgi:hypothetical protein